MKNSLILLLSVFVLSACGGKKKAPTSFTFNAGALLSGTSANGGVMIVGTNGVDKFSAGITPGQAQNFSIDLNPGNWQFHAVAWLGGAGYMTGANRCGSAFVANISGAEVNVSLNLDSATCATSAFANASYLENATYGVSAFRKIRLNSCLNPTFAGNNIECNGSNINLDNLPGESLSFRIVAPGRNTNGVVMPRLVSNCYNLDGTSLYPVDLSSGLANTDVRLPIGGLLNFPFVIESFEGRDCNNFNIAYPMNDGVAGTLGVARKVFSMTTPTDTTLLTIADNYVGIIGSPFFDAMAGGYAKVPNVTCNGVNCFNIDSVNQGDYSNGRDPVRNAIWSVLGSRNNVSTNDYKRVGYGNAVVNVPSDLTGGSITVNSSVDGKDFNVNSTNGTYSVSCTNNSISIVATSESPTTVANQINSDPSCNQYFTASAVEGTGTYAWSNIGVTATGLSDQLQLSRRDVGSLHEVQRMLMGPIGALLFQAGITTGLQLCTQSASHTVVLDGETINVTLGVPTGSATVHPFSNSTGTYERKILLTIDGVAEEAFYFNCDSAGAAANKIYDGAYASYFVEDNGAVGRRQMYWNLNSTGDALIEDTSSHVGAGESHYFHAMLRVATGAANDWDIWSVQGSPTNNYYSNLSATNVAGTLDVKYLSSSSATDGTLITAYDQAFTISTGTTATQTATYVTNTYTHKSILDLGVPITGEMTIDDFFSNTIDFWPLSN